VRMKTPSAMPRSVPFVSNARARTIHPTRTRRTPIDRTLEDSDARPMAGCGGQLDDSIQSFLRLLVPYFLLPAAGHCLELLVRRYEVQHYNATALLAAFLPYHATNHYVRLVQLVSLPAHELWQWLTPAQAAGAAVPRSLVVERAHRSPPLLTLLCDNAVVSPTCSTTTGFVCVVLTELLASHAPPADAQLATLLPLLQAALSSKAPVEFQAGALMVLAQLGCGTVLADAVVAQLLSAVVKGAHESLRAQALQLCLLYCRSQSLTSLPGAAFAHLVKWGELATLAGRLCSECDASALLTPLLQELVRRVSSSHHASLLRELLALPALPPPAAAAAATALLSALTEEQEQEQVAETVVLREVLTALARSHAAQTNHAVKRLVERAPKSSRKALAARLASLLGGSAAAPMANSGRDGVVTLMEVSTNA
jgi:hypothetical protein